MQALGLLVVIGLFCLPAFSQSYECEADQKGQRVEKFEIEIKDKEITGKITGSPKPKEASREYRLGVKPGATLKVLPETILKSKAGDAFLTNWKDGKQYSVFFSLEKDSATLILVEPEAITTEYFGCSRKD